MEKRQITFSPPDITEAEIEAVADTLRSGWITTGPKCKEFEKKIAQFIGTDKAVVLNSATACLESILRFLGIGAGDEVITSAYTYTASASPVVHVGASLKLVDCKKDSFEIDYDAIENAITEKTKAIIPVDIAGVPCDYDRIFEIVEKKKNLFQPSNDIQKAFGRIIVAADGAHAFGAYINKKQPDGTVNKIMVGNIADFTSFSFHAVKNFTTAEGGGLVWRPVPGVDDEEIYHNLMLLTLHGQSKDALAKTKLGAWEYDIKGPYYKCNMTDILAAVGLVQQKRYKSLLARRKEIIERYDEWIKDDDIMTLKHFDGGNISSGHLYLVRVLPYDEEKRNSLITAMAEAGIATNVHYKPLPMHTAYKNLGFDIKDFPNSYEMYKNEITLPLHTCLTDEQTEYIIENFNRLRKI